MSSSSKKKSMTTMTLKDFHGGTIPTDLPLPSAPGVSAPARPAPPPHQPDHHRQAGPTTRRPHHPQVAPPPPFLPAPPRGIPIGRHFDEDERTPFTPSPQPPAASRSDNPNPVSNAWAARSKESAHALGPGAAQQGPTAWSATRIAQASAVEKVISGKWHSKAQAQAQAAVGPTTQPQQQQQQQQVEVEVERPRSQVGERGGGAHQSAVAARPASHEGRVGVVGDVVTERPKLKLLPRSKPLETAQPEVFEEEQV